MRLSFRVGLAATTLLLLTSAILLAGRSVVAAGIQPPGPDRYAVVTEKFISYTWWLARWADSKIACEIEVDHGGLPTGNEVYIGCGETLYMKWLATQPCLSAASDPASCTGYYLHYVKSEPGSRPAAQILPPPMVWLTLDGCIAYASSYQCDDLPTLVLTGEEPLTGYRITELGGYIDNKSFTCDPICQVDLGPTDTDGLDLKFWAFSSYGDSSVAFKARIRVRASDNPEDLHWYVDVLSPQWRGNPTAACALGWDVFPPVGGLGGWLSTPESSLELASNIPYDYLAGNLIKHAIVDASTCPDAGLLENGYASPCGSEIARSAVEEWQNQFDILILQAARDVGVPAQLLKNLFSRESQFWPGVTSQRPEAGLGQLTNNGADSALLWNRPFFEQFCPLVLDNAVCQKGYPHMSEEQRAALRVALVHQVDAFCPDCPLGIDLDEAEASINIFAETLLANCAQAGMVVELNYDDPVTAPTYEDLWRFTLTNYNAGPGCLGLAIDATARASEPLDWAHVSSHFTTVCSPAIDYVNDVAFYAP